MGMCSWDCCKTLVLRVNPKTDAPYAYCDEHREWRRTYDRNRYIKHKTERRVWAKNKRQCLRNEFLKMYGGKCICCHIDEEVFLALDHVKNGGTAHRKQCGTRGVYLDAISKYDPERFQILCHNCNFAKFRNGICPHQLVGQEN